MKPVAATGSSCAVGSSRMSRSGRITSTDARFKSCFLPPESVETSLENHSVIPKLLAISATLAAIVSCGTPRFSSPNASSCHTLSVTICCSGFCMTNPTAAAEVFASSPASDCPLKQISPENSPSGVNCGFSIRRSVDLPLPVAPHNTVNSPRSIENDTFFTAGSPQSGYLKLRSSTLSISILCLPPLLLSRV